MRPIALWILSAILLGACAKAPPVEESTDASASPSPPVAPKPASPCPVVPTHDAAGNPLPQPQWTADSPVGITATFYEQHLPHAGSGAPDAATLASWSPLLSQALVAALERARAERDAAIAANPDEKPPYVEGALFVSLFEGYKRAQPITVAMEGERAGVPVCFAFESDGQLTEWADTVKLVRENGAWRIDDVVYGGQWDFANTGTLREALPNQ